MSNPGYIIAKKHTPQAWGFDALSAVRMDGNGTSPGTTAIGDPMVLPQACKIPKVAVIGFSVAGVAAGTQTFNIYVVPASETEVYPTEPLPLGPSDNSAVNGYPTVFAGPGDGLFAVAQVLNAADVPATTVVPPTIFVTGNPETVYPAGTQFILYIKNTDGAGSVNMQATLLVQFLDLQILNDNSSPTAW